ncbi:GNAT family N-acetyltransferase [Acetobacter cibinongensis]|nr:GNAT family N-acetyltransferase [Acetobacter cibinongensis]
MTTEITIRPLEPTTRMKVCVTFMQMAAPPEGSPVLLPDGWSLRLIKPSVTYYRYLQDHVGRAYCWWMRQASTDAILAGILHNPAVQIGLLMQDETPYGFFEFDLTAPQDINLSYFGLFPEAVGKGIGRAFLDAVVRLAWSYRPTTLRVNTCTADHPRALPFYQQAGFVTVKEVEEVWDVPQRLGLSIPERFLA